jgi:hypothetical protein
VLTAREVVYRASFAHLAVLPARLILELEQAVELALRMQQAPPPGVSHSAARAGLEQPELLFSAQAEGQQAPVVCVWARVPLTVFQLVAAATGGGVAAWGITAATGGALAGAGGAVADGAFFTG